MYRHHFILELLKHSEFVHIYLSIWGVWVSQSMFGLYSNHIISFLCIRNLHMVCFKWVWISHFNHTYIFYEILSFKKIGKDGLGLSQESTDFFLKSQIVNISGFSGHVPSVSTTQLYCCCAKSECGLRRVVSQWNFIYENKHWAWSWFKL